jgi:hypothetical protein
VSRQPDDRTVKLDDLFAAAGPAPRERRWPLLAWAGVQALAASFISYMLLFVTNNALPYPLVLGVCLGAALVRHALKLVREPTGQRPADLVERIRVRLALDPDWYEGGDGMVEAVGRWDRHLSWGAMGGDRFSFTVGRELGELVDERLRQRYGFTRATDPARAWQLLGPRVWALLGPVPTPPAPRQILAALADLDRLPAPDDIVGKGTP